MKTITIVDTGHSYAVCDDDDFQTLLKNKLRVKDIMDTDNKVIPVGFKSLKDGGKYTVSIPARTVPFNTTTSNQGSNSYQSDAEYRKAIGKKQWWVNTFWQHCRLELLLTKFSFCSIVPSL